MQETGSDGRRPFELSWCFWNMVELLGSSLYFKTNTCRNTISNIATVISMCLQMFSFHFISFLRFFEIFCLIKSTEAKREHCVAQWSLEMYLCAHKHKGTKWRVVWVILAWVYFQVCKIVTNTFRMSCFCHSYLHQGDYVFGSNCMCIILSLHTIVEKVLNEFWFSFVQIEVTLSIC